MTFEPKTSETIQIPEKIKILSCIGVGATASTYLVERVIDDSNGNWDQYCQEDKYLCLKLFDQIPRKIRQIPMTSDKLKQAKKLRELNKEIFKNEIQNLVKVHEISGVIGLHGCGAKAKISDENGSSFTCPYILFDYAENGNLFDACIAFNGLGEAGAHMIFTKIVKALHELHSKEVVHLDLKPENILLDGDFNPQIADFGSSKF